jgi:amidase
VSDSASNDDLIYLSATEAVERFKTKSLSPVELLRAQIDRIEKLEPSLNALTYTYFDKALEQARMAETRYARGQAVRPLEGITCAIKDFHAIEGEIATSGSRVFADFRPDQTTPTIERLIDAGAIVHGRTTTSEFAHAGVTKSLLWGISRNPWNPEFSPGGSSGGAGASLAAGYTTVADGSDAGGSIRVPASLNGVFGYKPPWGRNPLGREHPGEWLLHYGPLARSVADCALMQNVTSGVHPADFYSLRDKVVLPSKFEGIEGMKIAFSMDLGYYEIDKTVRANTHAAIETLRSLGATVDDVEIGWGVEVRDAFAVRWQAIFHVLVGGIMPQWHDEIDPYVVKMLERGKQISLSTFYGVNKVRQDMYKTLSKIFENYDLLMCPTTATTHIPADRNSEDPLIIDGKSIEDTFSGWLLTYPFNLVSMCPVMSVPTGFDAKTRIPTGMQLIGKTYDDMTVFRGAAAFEGATRPWQSKRPNLTARNGV